MEVRVFQFVFLSGSFYLFSKKRVPVTKTNRVSKIKMKLFEGVLALALNTWKNTRGFLKYR